jgi:hypothetical protein
VSDDVKVSIKKVATHNAQLPVALYLSSERLLSDPRNRSVPILDVILLPGNDEYALLIMPFLREWDNPFFNYRCEFVEAIRQFILMSFLQLNLLILMCFLRRVWNLCTVMV